MVFVEAVFKRDVIEMMRFLERDVFYIEGSS